MASKETKISSVEIYNGKVIKLRKDLVKIENSDVEAYREIITHNGGCCALIKTKEGKIKFVKQFRYAYNEFTLELPAGKCEVGEKPIETITREVEEEAGIIPNNIIELGMMYPSPGYTNEIIHLYYIDDYKNAKVHFDEDEDLDLLEFTMDEALEMIENGKIVDAKTIILIYKCLKYFKK